MKIAHILWDGSIGGAERFAHDLAVAQRAEGHDAQLWIAHDNGWFGEDAARKNVPVRLFGMKSGRDLAMLIKITRTLKEQRFDVVHMHTGTMLFDTWAVLLKPAKYIRHFHGVLMPKSRLVRILDKAINNIFEPSVFCNIFNSKDTLVRVRTERRLSLHTAQVVPCGIDMNEYRTDAVSRQRMRAALGLPENAFVIGGVGRLCPQKGFEDFIGMARIINATSSEVFFLLVGDGPSRASLELVVRDVGLSDRFLFAGFRSDIPSVLSALDCLVIPSRCEAFGIVCLESLAAGCPVVAYDVDGIHEAGGDTPLYAEPGEVAQLAGHVKDLLDSFEKRSERIQKGRQHVRQFDISIISRLIIDLYIRSSVI